MRRLIFCICVMAFGPGIACVAVSQEPNPESLLLGVQSRRESLPECSFTMVASGSFVGGGGDKKSFHVNYSNGKFLLKKDKQHATLFRDGEAIYYNPDSCVIKDPQDSNTIGFLYDPRLLGLGIGYWASLDLDVALRNENRESIKIIGREVIDQHDCWKVRVNDEWGEAKVFWIDPKRDFRVLKCEHQIFDDVGTSLSFYENDFDYLPSKVVTKRIAANGKVQYEFEVLIENVNLNPKPCAFDLASLEMSIGTPVSDIRIKKRIGYWNGTKLVDFVSKSPLKEDTTRNPKKYYVWCGVILGLVAFFAIAARFKRPRK